MYNAINVFHAKDTSGGDVHECYSKSYGYLLGKIVPNYMREQAPQFVAATMPMPGIFQDEMEEIVEEMRVYAKKVLDDLEAVDRIEQDLID